LQIPNEQLPQGEKLQSVDTVYKSAAIIFMCGYKFQPKSITSYFAGSGGGFTNSMDVVATLPLSIPLALML
jgi:hypothetical protein